MLNERQSVEARIREVAETLKRNGLAASDTEALRMAENMVKTELRLLKQYEEKKDDAFMMTSPSQREAAKVSKNKEENPPFREKEESAQETPQAEEPAPTNPQSNNYSGASASASSSNSSNESEGSVVSNEFIRNKAIADAINNVKKVYSQGEASQKVDLEEGVDINKPLAEVLDSDKEAGADSDSSPQEVSNHVSEEEVNKGLNQPSQSVSQYGDQTTTTNDDSSWSADPSSGAEKVVDDEPIVLVEESDNKQDNNHEQASDSGSSMSNSIPSAAPSETNNANNAGSADTSNINIANNNTNNTNNNTNNNSDNNGSDFIVADDEDVPEKTQEIKDKPPKKDISSMPESKVDLSSVFNFGKR